MFLAGLLILVTAGAGDPLQDAPHRIVKDLAQRTVLQLGALWHCKSRFKNEV